MPKQDDLLVMSNSSTRTVMMVVDPTDDTCLDVISEFAEQLGLEGWSNTIHGKEQEAIFLTREMRNQLMRLLDAELPMGGDTTIVPARSVPALSDREIEVLRWASIGKSVSVTAQILNVNVKTVHATWKNIFQKFDCHNTIQCIVAATRLGLL